MVPLRKGDKKSQIFGLADCRLEACTTMLADIASGCGAGVPGFACQVPSWGGAEAEGFGVGIHDEEPTPVLRALPPERGFFR